MANADVKRKENKVAWKIDGVGVADCKYFELGACRLKCYLAQGAIIKDGRCEGFKCYYKQEKTEKEKLIEAISSNLQTFKDVVEDAQEDIYFKLLPENPTVIDYCLAAIYEARNEISYHRAFSPMKNDSAYQKLQKKLLTAEINYKETCEWLRIKYEELHKKLLTASLALEDIAGNYSCPYEKCSSCTETCPMHIVKQTLEKIKE